MPNSTLRFRFLEVNIRLWKPQQLQTESRKPAQKGQTTKTMVIHRYKLAIPKKGTLNTPNPNRN